MAQQVIADAVERLPIERDVRMRPRAGDGHHHAAGRRAGRRPGRGLRPIVGKYL